MGDERIREFSEVEDLIFICVKLLLRPFLRRDRHRASEKTHLRTIGVYNTDFACRLPFEGAFFVSGWPDVDFVSWEE